MYYKQKTKNICKKLFSLLLTTIFLINCANALEIQLPRNGTIQVPTGSNILLAVGGVTGNLTWEITGTSDTQFVDLLGDFNAGEITLGGKLLKAANPSYVFVKYLGGIVTITCTDDTDTKTFKLSPQATVVTENIILTSVSYADSSAEALAALLRSVGVHSTIKTTASIYARYPDETHPNINPEHLLDSNLIGYNSFESRDTKPTILADVPDKINFVFPDDDDNAIEKWHLENVENIHTYLAGIKDETHFLTIFGNMTDVPPSWLVEEKENSSEATLQGNSNTVVATDYFYGIPGLGLNLSDPATAKVTLKVGRMSVRDLNTEAFLNNDIQKGDNSTTTPKTPEDTQGGSQNYVYSDGVIEGGTVSTGSHAGVGPNPGSSDQYAGYLFLAPNGLTYPIIGSLDVDDVDDEDNKDSHSEFFIPGSKLLDLKLSSIAGKGGAYSVNGGLGTATAMVPGELAGMAVRVVDSDGNNDSKWFYTIKDNGYNSIIVEDDTNYNEAVTPASPTVVNVGSSSITIAGAWNANDNDNDKDNDKDTVSGNVLYFSDKHLAFEVNGGIINNPGTDQETSTINVRSNLDQAYEQINNLIEIGDTFVVINDSSQIGPTADGSSGNLSEPINTSDTFEVYTPRDLSVILETNGPYEIKGLQDDAILMVRKQIEWLRQWYGNPLNNATWFKNTAVAASSTGVPLERHQMSAIELLNSFDTKPYVGSFMNGLNVTKFFNNYILGVNEFDFKRGDDDKSTNLLSVVSSESGYPEYGFLYAYDQLPLGPKNTNTQYTGNEYTIGWRDVYNNRAIKNPDTIPFRTITTANTLPVMNQLPQKLPIIITTDNLDTDGKKYYDNGGGGVVRFSSGIQANRNSNDYSLAEVLTGYTTGHGGGAIAVMGPTASRDRTIAATSRFKIKDGFFDQLDQQYLDRFPWYVARAYHRREQYIGGLFTTALNDYIANSTGEDPSFHQWAYLRLALAGCPAMPIPVATNWAKEDAEDHDAPVISGISSERRVGGEYNNLDIPVYEVKNGSDKTITFDITFLKSDNKAVPKQAVFAVYDITTPYNCKPVEITKGLNIVKNDDNSATFSDDNSVTFRSEIKFKDRYENATSPGPGIYMLRTLFSDNESSNKQFNKESRFFFEVVNEPPTKQLNANYIPDNLNVDDGTSNVEAEILIVDDGEYKPYNLFQNKTTGYRFKESSSSWDFSSFYHTPTVSGGYGYGFMGWFWRSIDYSMWGKQGNDSQLLSLTPANYPWNYSIGTVNVSKDDNVVIGTNTNWLSPNGLGNIKAGDYIQFDPQSTPPSKWYKIASIDSNTKITLTESVNSDYTSKNYTIRMPFHRTWFTAPSRRFVDRNFNNKVDEGEIFNYYGNAGNDDTLGTADDEGYHGCITASVLASYNAKLNNNPNNVVIWQTGTESRVEANTAAGEKSLVIEGADALTSTLTGLDQKYLATFLGQGGKLFLTGLDIASDLNSDTENGKLFLENYLHVTFESQSSGATEVTGVPTDDLGNLFGTISITGGTGANINGDSPGNYKGWSGSFLGPDQIQVKNTATSFLTYGNKTAGIRAYPTVDGPALVYLPWAFQGIDLADNNATGRNTVLKEIYNWLRKPTLTGDNTLAISPGTVKVNSNQAIPLYAVGGNGEYQWSIVQNSTNGTLSSTSGSYVTWTPGSTTGTDRIMLSDGNASAISTVLVGISSADFIIVKTPVTSVVSGDTVTLQAVGQKENAVITWSILTNNTGASLSSTTGSSITYTAGSISGADTISATDGTATANISVIVDPNPSNGGDSGSGDSDDEGSNGGGGDSVGGGGCIINTLK